MQTSQLELHNVNLHVLSPIHIGTDQELDPFSYVIMDNNLLLIDLIKWIENYPEQEDLHSVMDSDNFADIRSFIAEKIDPESVTLGRIKIESSGLVKTYNRVIKTKDSRNQLLINGMTRNEVSQVSYIPGSSIKGAIRTAIANHFVKAAGVTSKDKRNYSEKIFGRINMDPMRNLKLSDVSLDNFGSMIIEAEEFSLKEDKSKTPKGYKEVSMNLCQGSHPVVYPLRLSLKPFPLHGQDVNISFLIDALYRFYVSKYKDEYSKFYCLDHADQIRKDIAPMSLAIANLKTNETLVRIGHFAHVECVTLDKVREPKTRMVNGRRMPYGTTRTLANGIYPFGWAKLEFIDLKSEDRETEDWPFTIQEIESYVQAKEMAEQKSQKAAKAAEARRKKEEKKRQEEEKRKAELEAMSPEERNIAEIGDSSVLESRVVDIYKKIDEFSEENRNTLALALKKYWQISGKWEKGSKKQRLKVKKIKGILGEL